MRQLDLAEDAARDPLRPRVEVGQGRTERRDRKATDLREHVAGSRPHRLVLTLSHDLQQARHRILAGSHELALGVQLLALVAGQHGNRPIDALRVTGERQATLRDAPVELSGNLLELGHALREGERAFVALFDRPILVDDLRELGIRIDRVEELLGVAPGQIRPGDDRVVDELVEQFPRRLLGVRRRGDQQAGGKHESVASTRGNRHRTNSKAVG